MTLNGEWWTETDLILKENSIENENILTNLSGTYKINQYGTFLNKHKSNAESGFSYEK